VHRYLRAPADAVQQVRHTTLGATYVKQPGDQHGDPRQSPPLVLHPAVRSRAGLQLVLQPDQPSYVQPARCTPTRPTKINDHPDLSASVTAVLEATRQRLADRDLALRRLGAGTYGVCEFCGRPIPAERLAARPAARTCVGCAGRA